jgi:hypothetical protein
MTELTGLDLAGDAAGWRVAGFTVGDDGAFTVGAVRLTTGAAGEGIAGWMLGGPDAGSGTATAPLSVEHPNGATLLDHVVVFTDDVERTVATYATVGLDVRRVRDIGHGRTQTFFRAGEVIVELVGPLAVEGETFFGLAFTVADLDACAGLLGERLGAVKDAVQPGRRIATLRHEDCGLRVPVAFMSPEPRPAGAA